MTRRRDEDGTVALFLIGLLLVAFMWCGLAIDFARLVAADRALATATDASAAAGANGLDERSYRADGSVRLDPSRARALAADAMGAQPEADDLTAFTVDVTDTAVTVRSTMTVHLSLLRLVTPDVEVHATATASPRRAP